MLQRRPPAEDWRPDRKVMPSRASLITKGQQQIEGPGSLGGWKAWRQGAALSDLPSARRV